MKVLAKHQPLAVALIITFAVIAGMFAASPKAAAATPVPAQCIMNLNILGGAAAMGRVACNTLGDASSYADGKCYKLDSSPGVEIDCSQPPINNLWTYKCQGSDSVFQSYIDLSKAPTQPADPADNDPVKSCADAGATYVPTGAATAAPTAPTGQGTAPTTPPAPTTPTAPSGSGATTASSPYTPPPGNDNPFKTTANDGAYWCGSDQSKEVALSIDLGCVHKDPAILDLIFAITRLLSNGVGIIVIGSIVFAGIQYTASRGDPQQTAQAQGRVMSSVIALLIFLFSYAILNWLVPAGLLK